MKRFRNVSAIVSLLAGFITAVVMVINKYDLLTFIWILAVVMAVFYIVSRIICFICDRHITKEEEKAEEERLEKEKQEIIRKIREIHPKAPVVESHHTPAGIIEYHAWKRKEEVSAEALRSFPTRTGT